MTGFTPAIVERLHINIELGFVRQNCSWGVVELLTSIEDDIDLGYYRHMINAVVAIDEKRGLADDNGIPWDVPTDAKYFVDKIKPGMVLMGYGTYVEVEKPFHGRTNYVATTKQETLRPGFEAVHDVNAFLDAATEDVWVIGGAGLFAATLDRIDIFYVTEIGGDFNSTKFLPEFGAKFKLVASSDKMIENGTTFQYQTWQRTT